MGSLMGARAQMWQGNLNYMGMDNRGQIIVRTEAVKSSNEAVKINCRVHNPNNEGAGCLGMCKDKFAYRFEVQKAVPGTSNFARCSPLGR